MVSGSMTSFQQWSSKSRAMVCSCVTISIPFLLLHPHVLGEIIIRGMVAFVDLSAARAVIARVEHALEKSELQHPGGFCLLPAIPAGHGIVELPVRSTGVDLDHIALVVAIEAVAEAPHVGERDHMAGLTENAENRTLDRGNDVVERLGIARASLPFALRGRAIPDERRRERTLRRQHQRMASGLADALDSDFRCVDLRKLDELGNRRVEIGYGLRVGHVIADLAAVKRCLIRMLVEEIRRDADVTVAGKALGQIPRVLHKAIALVHEHDSRCFGNRCGNGKEGGEFSSAAHGFEHLCLKNLWICIHSLHSLHTPSFWRYRTPWSQDNAGIAQVAVAVDQVDLANLDLPAIRALHEAVAAPAREESRPVHAKLVDQEIRADHARGIRSG